MLRRLTRRERFMALLLFASIFIYLYLNYMLIPLYNTTITSREQLDNLSEEVRTVMQTASQYEEENLSYADNQKKLQIAVKNFNYDLVDGLFVVRFSRELKKQQVYVDSYVPGEIVDKSVYLKMPVELRLSGDYVQVVNMIRYFENQVSLMEFRSIKIEQMKITNNGSDDAQAIDSRGLITATCLLNMYSVPTPKGKLLLEDMQKWTFGRKNPFFSLGTAVADTPIIDQSADTDIPPTQFKVD